MPKGVYVRRLTSIGVRLLRRSVRVGSCLLWRGARDGKNKYGLIGVTGGGAIVLTHRAAYTAWVGPIPDGLDVLHRCDIPNCIEPLHLFTGTPADNNADMVSKGRHTYGQRNAMAKLSDAAVRRMRQLHDSGVRLSDIHRRFRRRYDVSLSTVHLVLQHKTWRHVS